MLQSRLGYKRMVTQTTVTLSLGKNHARCCVARAQYRNTVVDCASPVSVHDPEHGECAPQRQYVYHRTWSNILKSYPTAYLRHGNLKKSHALN